ncbi:hypothetical protein [Thermococcus sp. AM4]|uniref:hypothetical protein n=1 Tax=Thermococcus sp. (strain AM4) TaxID=246969 RepID=UPI000187138B|nr:hypothetical protein [Thermococcus sp. AM4]EEB72928.1 hypothetical protein TAM4_2459 [Thermococcus sp. AM4]
MNDVLHNLNEILRKVIQIENDVEELKIMVLKMIADNLPEEEIDEETLSRLKAELKNLKPENVSGLSVEEFIELLEKDKE